RLVPGGSRALRPGAVDLRRVGERPDLVHERAGAIEVQRAVGPRAPAFGRGDDARELDPRLDLVKARVARARDLERFVRSPARAVERAGAQPRGGEPREVPGLGVER